MWAPCLSSALALALYPVSVAGHGPISVAGQGPVSVAGQGLVTFGLLCSSLGVVLSFFSNL